MAPTGGLLPHVEFRELTPFDYRMAVQPITYLAIKYPAPICERCGLAMLTVTIAFGRCSQRWTAYQQSHMGARVPTALGWPQDGRRY